LAIVSHIGIKAIQFQHNQVNLLELVEQSLCSMTSLEDILSQFDLLLFEQLERSTVAHFTKVSAIVMNDISDCCLFSTILILQKRRKVLIQRKQFDLINIKLTLTLFIAMKNSKKKS